MRDLLGLHLPTLFACAGLFLLWFLSSVAVAEGLVYGPGRWWPFFVAIKAGSACVLLFSLMLLFGQVLRGAVYRRCGGDQ